MLALLNATLLNPLQLEGAHDLVVIYQATERNPYSTFTYADFVDYRERTRSLKKLSAVFHTPLSVATGAGAQTISAALVSPDYFNALGTAAQLGRTLSGTEAPAGSNPEAVLGYESWLTLYGGDDTVIGRTVRINKHPFVIVGVMPPEFKGHSLASRARLWVPLSAYPQVASGFFASFKAVDYHEQRFTRRRLSLLTLLGRVDEGIHLDQVRTDFERVGQQLAGEFPESNEGLRPSVVPASLAAVGPSSRPNLIRLLMALLVSVVLVALLGCANIANLLLADATQRRPEIALRTALGAGRTRLFRQWLTESLCLGVLAGGLSLIVASTTVAVLRPYTLPGGIDLTDFSLPVDWRLAAVTVGLAVAAAMAFGVLPAAQASRRVQGHFAGRSAAGRMGNRLRGLLLVAQVSIALVLTVSAGLFVRSASQAMNSDLGFDPNPLVAATVDLGENGYDSARAFDFYRSVKQSLLAEPGIEAVTATDTPFGRTALSLGRVFVEDRALGVPLDDVLLNRTEPDYFQTLGVPIVQGRAHAERDARSNLVVVSRSLAERLWPQQDPIGKLFNFSGPEDGFLEVIGVAANVRQESLDEIPPFIVYRSFLQNRSDLLSFPLTFLARTSGDPADLLAVSRRVIQNHDPQLAVSQIIPLTDQVAAMMMPQSMGRVLLGGLGLVASLVMAVGIYAAVSFGVRQRRPEIGVRLAIGASRADVTRLVFRAGMLPTVAGIAVGFGVCLIITPALQAFLFGVEPLDPTSLIAGGLLVALISAAACGPVAREAARMDPTKSLVGDP